MSVNEEVHYTVDKILKKRYVEDVPEYLVEWRGSDGTSGTDWEPEDNLVSADPSRCEVKKFNRLWEAHLKKMEKIRVKKAAAAAAAAASTIVKEDDFKNVFVKPYSPATNGKVKKLPCATKAITKKGEPESPELMVVIEKLSAEDLKDKSILPENPTEKRRPGRPPSKKTISDQKGLKPERIVGATKDDTGQIKFALKWKETDTTVLIPVFEANMLYPQLVIEFYQDHIAWEKR